MFDSSIEVRFENLVRLIHIYVVETLFFTRVLGSFFQKNLYLLPSDIHKYVCVSGSNATF